ncbi:glycosyltransferase [Pantoea vagans]|uniref:glycosyltransferase n=1 Tax=Pantoea vagans TaxID=470934 RepID=UPI0023AFADA1|nr:glycosyltransferase [Pantoea vagans]MDE8557658.1 glycosyltransferase [Pantoea vagans]MDE8577226.1 glycosyltransferase [Pantoea vagans]
MSHFAVIAPPFYSHVQALAHLSQALIARGHQITFLQQTDVSALLTDSRIGFFPLGLASHPAGSLAHTLQLAAHPLGPSMLKLINEMARSTEMLCRELPVMLKTLAIDGVIVDQMEPAGALAAESLNLPYVSVACALPLNREPDFPLAVMPFNYANTDQTRERYRASEKIYDWLMRRHDLVIARNAHAMGLTPREKLHHCFSPLAQISQLMPELDFPRQSLPDYFHSVGPLRAAVTASAASQPRYFPHGDKPRIFASLGTLQGHRYGLFKTIVRACHEIDAQLLLAHCGRLSSFQAEKLALSSHIQVVDFADQAAALAQADLAITHGGMNTVLDAVNHLTPLLAIPLAFDQPGVAARVVWHGIGRRASRFTTSHALARQLQTLLADESYGQQMKTLRDALCQAGGSALAADIVEQAMHTRKPVITRRDYAAV